MHKWMDFTRKLHRWLNCGSCLQPIQQKVLPEQTCNFVLTSLQIGFRCTIVCTFHQFSLHISLECTLNAPETMHLRFLECTWNALAFCGMHLERMEFKRYKQKNSSYSYIISFVKSKALRDWNNMPVTGGSCHIHEYWNVRGANNEEFGPASNGLQNHRFHAQAFFRSHLSAARDADCNRNQILTGFWSNAPSMPVLQ